MCECCGVEFALLGPVEAEVDLGPHRQRAVLVALLLDANRPVSVERLAERVWGERVPDSARRTLFSYLSRLRSAGVPISRQPTGYVLTASVDLLRYRDLAARARSTEDLALYDEALALWRGEPFAGVDSPWLDVVRAGLIAERHALELDRTDLALRRGRHAELLVGLAAQCAAHPLDERLAAQYLLALHRSGRTADALAQYDEVRRRLADELGIDPGGPLQRRHQQVLMSEIPHQLPGSPMWFTGRTKDLDGIEVGGTWLISGTGGIGKTSLALRWAHQHLDEFPDGQLHVDLRGFDPSRPPVSAEAVLRGFLRALGITAIPADLEAQVGLYRTVTAQRRMLVVLDNARDVEQVTPLLPGGSRNTVLVTSRNQLRGFRPVPLDVLDPAEARAVLVSHVGEERVAAEPEAVAELLERCAGLPLALGIVAARAALRPDFPLRAFAEELGEDPLHDLRAVFSWSLRALDDDAVEVFGLLGLAPGPDISLAAARVLTDKPKLLRTLENAHLVHQHVPGRYRMHDLVRLYAGEQSADPAALRRVVDFYLGTAAEGARLLNPLHALDLPPGEPLDRETALAWFEAEHLCLLAVQELAVERGWHVVVGQIAWVLWEFYSRNGYLLDQRAVWQKALAVGDRPVRCRAHRVLGTVDGMLGSRETARAHLDRAIELADDGVQLAHSRMALARVLAFDDEFDPALALARQALEFFTAADESVWLAMAHHAVGWYLVRLGDHDEGRDHLETALALFRAQDYQGGEDILAALGYLAHHAGRDDEALEFYRQALAVQRSLGNVYDEAIILEDYGRTLAALGRRDPSRDALRRARDLYRAQHRMTKAASVQDVLDQLSHGLK
jgi:DNA-binding SARP family transcriptional activator